MEKKNVLKWNKDYQADGYIVAQHDDDKVIEIVRVENINITTIVIPNIKKGIENHFRVSFYNKKDNNYFIYKNEDYYCFASPKGLNVYRFPTPKLKKATKADKSIIIEWEIVSDDITYAVIRKISGGAWKRIGLTKETKYVDSEIDTTKRFIYTVRCVSSDGKKYLSSWSVKGIFA